MSLYSGPSGHAGIRSERKGALLGGPLAPGLARRARGLGRARSGCARSILSEMTSMGERGEKALAQEPRGDDEVLRVVRAV